MTGYLIYCLNLSKRGEFMKRQLIIISILGFVFGSIATVAYADDAAPGQRVIEETLILKDPTVSAAGKWVYGVSLEALYVNAPFTSWSSSLDGTTEKGHAKGGSAGLNLFGGYGDFTLDYSYREGHGSSTLTHEASTVAPYYTHSVKAIPTQNEIIGRWLARSMANRLFTPYLYLGYSYLDSNFDDTITTPGVFWPYNSTNKLSTKETMNSVIAGVGGIFPVSEDYGFRLDLGLTGSRGNMNREDGFSKHGTGLGSRMTGTMYYNFSAGWNAQLGGRYEYFNAGDFQRMTIGGVFVMLGHTFK